MMRIDTLPLALALVCALTTSTVSADVIAEWTFSDRSTEATAMGSENSAVGATVSRLFINDSFDFAGLNNVPNSVHDGYGFGNLDNYLFLHRANYFDGSAVPPKENVSDYTSWGNGGGANPAGTGDNMSANGNAPLSFTVMAGSGQTVTIESLLFDRVGGANTIIQFQEAGAAVGPSVTLTSNTEFVVPLAAPVVIASGQTKSFTFNLNSGNLNSIVNLNDITLNGTVIPEPSTFALLAGSLLAAIMLRRRRK